MISFLIEIIAMTIATIQDIRRKEISVGLVVAAGVVSFITCIVSIGRGAFSIEETLLSLIPGALLLLIAFISRNNMGYGDGLLILAVGPSVGFEKCMLGLCIAFFISGIASIALIVIKRPAKGYAIPFIPFLTLGLGVSFFA